MIRLAKGPAARVGTHHMHMVSIAVCAHYEASLAAEALEQSTASTSSAPTRRVEGRALLCSRQRYMGWDAFVRSLGERGAHVSYAIWQHLRRDEGSIPTAAEFRGSHKKAHDVVRVFLADARVRSANTLQLRPHVYVRASPKMWGSPIFDFVSVLGEGDEGESTWYCRLLALFEIDCVPNEVEVQHLALVAWLRPARRQVKKGSARDRMLGAMQQVGGYEFYEVRHTRCSWGYLCADGINACEARPRGDRLGLGRRDARETRRCKRHRGCTRRPHCCSGSHCAVAEMLTRAGVLPHWRHAHAHARKHTRTHTHCPLSSFAHEASAGGSFLALQFTTAQTSSRCSRLRAARSPKCMTTQWTRTCMLSTRTWSGWSPRRRANSDVGEESAPSGALESGHVMHLCARATWQRAGRVGESTSDGEAGCAVVVSGSCGGAVAVLGSAGANSVVGRFAGAVERRGHLHVKRRCLAGDCRPRTERMLGEDAGTGASARSDDGASCSPPTRIQTTYAASGASGGRDPIRLIPSICQLWYYFLLILITRQPWRF